MNDLYEAVMEGRAPVKAKVEETENGFKASVKQWGIEVEHEATNSSTAQSQAVQKFVKQVAEGKYKRSRF